MEYRIFLKMRIFGIINFWKRADITKLIGHGKEKCTLQSTISCSIMLPIFIDVAYAISVY